MDEKTINEILIKEFISAHCEKYKLISEEPIGTGADGFVIKCKDLLRNVDVAVKIFRKGISPRGTIRGWQLTTLNIHEQIAPTFTIENFHSTQLNLKCVAVVQRLVAGKSLKRFYELLDKNENESHFNEIINDLANTFMPSLLDVISYCHSKNFGHGDLHEGNIMVINNESNTPNFSAVLIDFDNASVSEILASKGEEDKILNDVGGLKRIYGQIFSKWKYYDAMNIIFANYERTFDIRFTYNLCLRLINMYKHGHCQRKDYFKLFKSLPILNIVQKHMIDALKLIAKIENKEVEFIKYFNLFSKHATIETTVTVTQHSGKIIKGYNDFFKTT